MHQAVHNLTICNYKFLVQCVLRSYIVLRSRDRISVTCFFPLSLLLHLSPATWKWQYRFETHCKTNKCRRQTLSEVGYKGRIILAVVSKLFITWYLEVNNASFTSTAQYCAACQSKITDVNTVTCKSDTCDRTLHVLCLPTWPTFQGNRERPGSVLIVELP